MFYEYTNIINKYFKTFQKNLLVFISEIQKIIFDLLNRFLIKQFFLWEKRKRVKYILLIEHTRETLKTFKAFEEVISLKTKNTLTVKNRVKKNFWILLQANTKILLNKTNLYMIKASITKAILVIKTLEISSV